MKKGIGPRALGSPLKQTTKATMARKELKEKGKLKATKTVEKKKMNPVEVAKEITPGVNALFRVADVAKRLKDLPEKVSKNKKTNK